MQTLLDRAGLRFAAEWAELNPPYRAVLRDAARDGKLLAQTLLVLLGARLIADGTDLHDEITAGGCGRRHGGGGGYGRRHALALNPAR